MAEGEGAVEGEKKKGGAKKLIIKIVPLLLIALVIAKMTVLKPPPPTPAQAAAKAAAAKLALDTKCALANSMTPPKAPAHAPGAAATETPTTAKPGTLGPTLDLDSKTMNLDGSHFLKIGVSLQLPVGSVPDTVKITENWGSIASQLVIDTFSGRSFAELSNDGVRERLQHEIGDEVCQRTDGKVDTVYFIDFVMQ
ncbi:MAG TPA: flagellar basal body-associated FliL family protein [Acidimicrobiia bacterium]|nr:flagellar basal body-associated FliL family protein [Acidimicrobiia bacterium]